MKTVAQRAVCDPLSSTNDLSPSFEAVALLVFACISKVGRTFTFKKMTALMIPIGGRYNFAAL